MPLWPLSRQASLFIVLFIVAGNSLLLWREFSGAALKTPDVQLRQHEITLQNATFEIALPEQFVLTEIESAKVVFSVPGTRSEPEITILSSMPADTGPFAKCISAEAGHSICYRQDSIPNGNGPMHERVSGDVVRGAGKRDLYFTIDVFEETFEPDPVLLIHYFRYLKRVSPGS